MKIIIDPHLIELPEMPKDLLPPPLLQMLLHHTSHIQINYPPLKQVICLHD